MALRNNTNDWVEIGKGTPIAWMEAANQVPPVDGGMVAAKAQAPEAMSEAQRREAVIQIWTSLGYRVGNLSWLPKLAICYKNIMTYSH